MQYNNVLKALRSETFRWQKLHDIQIDVYFGCKKINIELIVFIFALFECTQYTCKLAFVVGDADSSLPMIQFVIIYSSFL